MSNVSSARKKKVSVNPAKNAQKQQALSEDDDTKQKHSKNTSTSTEEKVNDLDKNRLKNWKLRRELKKALNSDLNSTKKAVTEPDTEELPKKEKGKNLKKHSAKSKKEKPEDSENIVEDDTSNDDTGLTDEIDVESLKDDPDQDYAPDRMEVLKFKAHRGLRNLMYKLLMIGFIKSTLIPKSRSVIVFLWRQLKKQSMGRIAFFVVSMLIIFAFIVPPMWGAIESYRSGIWRMFG